jgi:hypothetical protein
MGLTTKMRTVSFDPSALQFAYEQAAKSADCNFEEFVEGSKFFDFAVTSLGPGLSMDVECDTTMPVSTPAELREKKFQNILAKSQRKANEIAKKQAAVAERLAKKMERKMRKEQRNK